jgi:hypothetical protein
MRRFALVTATALLLGLGPPALHASAAGATGETVITAATTGAFDATLLDRPLQAGNCGVAVLIDDGGPNGEVGCTLVGVGGALVAVAMPVTRATTDGTTTATLSGTGVVSVGGLPQVAVPVSVTLTRGEGVRLTIAGVALPLLPDASDSISIQQVVPPPDA